MENKAKFIGAVAAAVLLAGCGLERLAHEDLSGTPHEKVKLSGEGIQGTHSIEGTPTITVLQNDGTPIEEAQVTVTSYDFTVVVPDGEYHNLRVVEQSEAAYSEALIPELHEGEKVQDVALGADSTAVSLVIQALQRPHQSSLALMRGGATAGIAEALANQLTAGGAVQALRDAVERVQQAAAGSSVPSMQTPDVDASYSTLTSAVNPEWLAATAVDLEGDGTDDTTTAPFDDLLVAAAQWVQLCPDPDYLRTILAVDFNEGKKDGSCKTINRFKWAQDAPGKSMFFTGGVHKDSPMQDPAVQAAMGAWTPNVIHMYDDGTHGDRLAGDNIYSITYDLPAGMRVAYKYTWGKPGTSWTGNEEWPGNQRILEIDDLSGDGIVYKYDNFADESTNKDVMNLYKDVNGHPITWDTDQNGDGVPEAREQKTVDETNACAVGDWPVVDWVGVALSYCGG